MKKVMLGRIAGIMLLSALCFSMLTTPANASKRNFSEAQTANGKTTMWAPSGTAGYSIVSGTSVNMGFTMKTAETNVVGGLYNANTTVKTSFCSGNGTKTMSGTKTVTTAGTYAAYFTNNSAGTVTTTNASYIDF